MKNNDNIDLNSNHTYPRTHNLRSIEAGHNLSWGSIIAGAVSFVAVFLVLSFITSALGFGFISPDGAQPLSGVGISTGISIVVSLLISFFCGGFIAGLASRRAGKLHGFLTWALSVLLLFTLIVSILSSALTTIGNVAGTVASGAASVAGSAASTVTDAASAGADVLYSNIAESVESVNGQDVTDDVKQILADTGVAELQPDYIQGQLNEATDEIVQAGKDLLVNPQNSDKIIDDLTSSLAARTENIAQEVDRDAISNSVAANTDLTGAEAEEAVENIYVGVQEASQTAQTQLNNAAAQVEETRVQLNQTVEDVKETADEVTNAFSAGSVVVFVGLIVGLVVAALGADLGNKRALEHPGAYEN